MIVARFGRGEPASDLLREGPQPHARVVPGCALRLQRRCPGSTDIAHGLRHTPSTLREPVSSAATRDGAGRRPLSSRIVANPMHSARPPIRKASEGTVNSHVARAFRPYTIPTGTWTHAMTSHAAGRTGLKQETIAIVAVGLTILGTMLFTTSRLEARIDRVAAEIRTEARADREIFTREILRLTAEQSRLAGVVEGARAD